MKQSRSLATLHSLCALGLHAEVLVPSVLEALHEFIPSYRNLFDWTDAQGRLVRYFIEGPIDARIAQLYFDEFHNRREAEAMPRFDSLARHPRGVRGAAELDHPGFFRSALYNEIWRPQGFHTRLEAVVRGTDGALVGSLVMYRAPGEPRFSLQDERNLAAVLPALAAGLQACGPAKANDRQVPSPEPPETLLMSLEGQVLHVSAGAHRMLLLADGGPSRDALSKPLPALAAGLLPMLLMRVRAQARPCGDGQRPLGPPTSITHETAYGQFVASGHLLQGLSSGPPSLVQVTLQRLEPHRVALERALRSLPLTAGQQLVCRHLLQGHTHAQIGDALGVAPATVIDHVRKLYRTLDLRSTLELAELLNARMAAARPAPGWASPMETPPRALRA